MSLPDSISYEDFLELVPKFRKYFFSKKSESTVELLDQYAEQMARNGKNQLELEASKPKNQKLLTAFFDGLTKNERTWVLRKLRDQRYELTRIRISVGGLTVGALEEIIQESGGEFKNFDEAIYKLISVYREQQKTRNSSLSVVKR